MTWRGDIKLGNTIDFKFCTVQSTGAPTTLASSPVLSAYVGNGTTEITAGITLTVDFDSRTGMNNCRVVASGGNGYATATDVEIAITTGTVNSVSAVGYVVGAFSIENRRADVQFWNGTQVASPATAGVPDVNAKNWNNLTTVALPLVPTTAGRTLDVTATGEAGIDWANIGGPTTTVNLSGTSTKAVEPTVAGRTLDIASTGEAGLDFANVNLPLGVVAALGIVDNGTLQAAADATHAQLRAAASFADDRLIGMTLVITGGTGVGQARVIVDYDNATDNATVDTWTTTPDNTSTYIVFASAPASTASPAPVNATQFAGQTITAAAGVTLPSSIASPTNITAGTITTATNLTNLPAITANWLTAAGIAADAGAEIADAVWDEATAGHTTAGSTGKALTDASSAGDPWSTALPGAYGAGTAGKIIGDKIAASVTGAVGSVTGNVGGNVIGSVASVTGNVGGNVVGSVASVTANVNADIKKINGTTVNGNGAGTPWGP